MTSAGLRPLRRYAAVSTCVTMMISYVDHLVRGPTVRIVSSCLVALLPIGLAASPAAAAEDSVRLNIGLVDTTHAASVLAELGDRVLDSEPVTGLPAVSVEVPASTAGTVITSLTADTARIRYAEPDGVVTANSELIGRSLPWARVPEAWTWTTGSPDVTVAVVDTGVTANADLPAARLTAGRDFVDDDDSAADDDGHGTQVASVIGATRGNDLGAAGVCDACAIMPVRVLRDNGTAPATGTIADAAAGIAWAADHDAEVINVSFSTLFESRLLRDAVDHATAAGSLIVGSAGNDKTTSRQYPAAYEPVLAVSAATLSPRNTASDHWVDLAAIDNTPTVLPDDTTAMLNGSSSATAVVAGAAALAFSLKPGVSAAEVREAAVRSNLPFARLPEHHAPLINTAKLMHAMGGEDTVAPVLTQTGLTEGESMSATGRLITPAATDDHGIDRVDFIAGGQVLATLNSIGAGISVRPPAGHHGDLPITVRAYDYAGNIAEQTVTVQVDIVAPTGVFVTPAEDGTHVRSTTDIVVTTPDADVVSVIGSVSLARVAGTNRWAGTVLARNGAISVVIRDQVGNKSTIVRKVQIDDRGPAFSAVLPGPNLVGRTFTTSVVGVSDLSGVAGAELWVNDVRTATFTDAPFAFTMRTPTETTNVTWKVTDSLGNVTTIKRRFIRDTEGPTIFGAYPPVHVPVRGTFTAFLDGPSDNSGGHIEAELLVNGVSYGRDVSAPYSFRVPTGTRSGYLNLTWKLTDGLGNTSTYPQRVRADNAGPNVAISKAPKNRAKVKGTVKVYAKASDASGVARVELLVNGKVVAKDATAGYLLKVNTKKQKKTMKVQVRAYDKLGNVKYTSTRTWYRK